jgi:hypothetical protein
MRVRNLRFSLMVFAALVAPPAFATCDDPAWDTATVMARLGAAVPLAAGQPLDRGANSGLTISLAPVSGVPFDVPPERPPRNSDPRGAVLHFDAGAAGTYRIALSARAWVDVVQDGKYLAPVAFVDFMDCADLHKIVAFEVGAGPFTLQLSDATAPSIAAAITPAP